MGFYQKRSLRLRMISWLLTAAFVFVSAFGTVDFGEAKKKAVYLSKSRLTLLTGQKKQLKVKIARKYRLLKKNYRSSDQNVVKVSSATGRISAVYAGEDSAQAVVTCRVKYRKKKGGKASIRKANLRCRVTVINQEAVQVTENVPQRTAVHTSKVPAVSVEPNGTATPIGTLSNRITVAPTGTGSDNAAIAPTGTGSNQTTTAPTGTNYGQSTSAPTDTASNQLTSTPSGTASGQATPTPTGTVSGQAAPTPMGTASGQATPTPTGTASGQATPTPTPTGTASGQATPTPTGTASGQAAPTPMGTASGQVAPTLTPTPTLTGTASGQATPTPTGTASGQAAPTPMGTASGQATPTPTPTGTASDQATPTPTPTGTTSGQPTPTSSVLPLPSPLANFTDLTAQEIIQQMGTGINVGNSMDAVQNWDSMEVNEYAWGAPTITKETFSHIKELGFSSVRIPITWGNTIQADGTVLQTRMERVKQLVDWAQEAGLYTIINVHHDGASDSQTYHNFLQLIKISDAENAEDPVYVTFAKLWHTIAVTFQEYDEHLLFEGMNEVYTNGYGWSGNYADGECEKINHLNQLFVDTVRATGGNNVKRWLIVPTKNTTISYAIDNSGFRMPTDAASRVMLSVHSYENLNATSYDEKNVISLGAQLAKLKTKYIDQGIPVFLGEYGPGTMPTDTFSTDDEGNHDIYEIYNYLCKKNQVIPMAWDTGASTNTGYKNNKTLYYGILDRSGNGLDQTQGRNLIIEGIFKGFKQDASVEDLPGYEQAAGKKFSISYAGASGQTEVTYIKGNGDYTFTFQGGGKFSSAKDSGSNWYLLTTLPSDDSDETLKNAELTIKSGSASVNGTTVALMPNQQGVHANGNKVYEITVFNPWNTDVCGFNNIAAANGADSITLTVTVTGL